MDFMALLAQEAFFETSDFRGKPRRTLYLPVNAAIEVSGQTQAIIHNLSESGLLVETKADLALGEWLHVEIPDLGLRSAQVAWASDGLFGCKFAEEMSKATVSAVFLRAPFENQPSVPVGLATVPAQSPAPEVTGGLGGLQADDEQTTALSATSGNSGKFVRTAALGVCAVFWTALLIYASS
ncbi:hypothetical protein Sa4125_09090 [Aureimonas sp. SA4125]|uniref:PilZ domain-containing protein n=1 Tax=Aureimonas sp. SA4125 TaxID=2826993 RepID=UPI001CC7EECA|nr:PilZ domain-containing protein [Aureimonas sp. SA4125]BDA83367.1 hypothetical protein Sa4125_09090 [Aureimonas sp. SA4125]